MHLIRRILLLALWFTIAAPALALDATRDDVRAFVGEMAERHGFEAKELGQVLAQAESRPSIVALMSRPAEKALPWDEYRARFLTERRIARGVETGRLQSGALECAAERGVPASVLLAIVGVETHYGENTGNQRVIDALVTLAFDYPRRGPFFRNELEQFLLMAREESLDPLGPRGSYAGAMGIPQFMPSSFRAYAVDGDGDGRRNLWASWSDVFASVASYLRAHGWRTDEPVMARADVADADLAGLEFGKVELTETVGSLKARGVRFDTAMPPEALAVLLLYNGRDGPEHRVGFTNFYAITRYNRSQLYASAVSDLADAIDAASVAAAPAAPSPPAE